MERRKQMRIFVGRRFADGHMGHEANRGLKDDFQVFILRNWVDGTTIYQDMGYYGGNILAENLESSFKNMLSLRCIYGHPGGEIKYVAG